MKTEELYNKTTEELYDEIVETLSSGNFLTLNGKPINLSELSDYINAQQQEIERLNNIIDKAINILELSAMNKGICTQIETDTIQHTLSILKGSESDE